MTSTAEHPGQEIAIKIFDMGLNLSQFARLIDVSSSRISDIVAEKRSITIDTAIKIAKAFGTTPEYWLNKQLSYDLQQKQKNSEEQKRMPSWKRS